MKIIREKNFRGRCKHCRKWFYLDRKFYNHLAYEHEKYVSKWYEFKAKIRKMLK